MAKGRYESTRLHTRWALWYHSATNNNWGRDSYAILSVAGAVDEVAGLRRFFEDDAAAAAKHGDGRMLFFMRERAEAGGRSRLVYPSWEDPANLDGGTVCASGPLAGARRLFWDLVAHAAGETICADPEAGAATINGVSIGTKADGKTATVKVWCGERPFPAGADGTSTPSELATLALRAWTPRARARFDGLNPYYVQYRKVKKKDAEETSRRQAHEYGQERRLQLAEMRTGRRRRNRTGRRRAPASRGGGGGRRAPRARGGGGWRGAPASGQPANRKGRDAPRGRGDGAWSVLPSRRGGGKKRPAGGRRWGRTEAE